ncbi:MAG: glycosyltransferase family 2 protein [Candidatus Aenigmarchaeota archaeon]|nr:glycosyltransferase family 2 protein [Candidatus Aenigmarchaeota archaeon]
MQLPSVSIIIVGYNSKPHFDSCFSSISRIGYSKTKYEVILADNNSKDGSVEYVKEKFKWVRILPLKENYGVAIAVNRAAKIAKGKYIVILNPDTEVEKKWLVELVKVMESDRTIGACGSKLLYYDERDKINTIGGFWSVLGFSGSLGEGDNKIKHTKMKEVFFPTGSSLMVRKDLFLSVGGYDDDYFMYVEEPDLSWRLWNMGYRIVSVPSSIAYHKVGASVKRGDGGFRSMVYYHTTKNRLATIVKNATFLNVAWMLPTSILAHIFQSLVFLARGRLDASWAVLKGILWIAPNFGKLVEKRSRLVHNGNTSKLMIGVADSIKIFFWKFKKHF